MKKALLWTLGILLLLASLSLVGYPFISNYLNSLNLSSEVMSYLNVAEDLSDAEYSEILDAAKKYNESLIGNVQIGIPFTKDENSSDEYDKLLSIDGSDVIASIEIPTISVNLPIYHGTSEDVLQKGVGHLPNSSLPIGGKGTHAVLTGHTGLSSQKLFSDISSLSIGDMFFIHILGDTLAYRIDEINTVLPSETDKLQIHPEEDHITLVTCTPFGVNSHRLLVRGTRTPYDEIKDEAPIINPEASTWNSQYVRAIIRGALVMAVILIVFLLIKMILYRYRKRKNDGKKDT